MFENKSDIYAFLAETGLGPYAATLEELCLPALAFQAEAKPVAARFGGLPDLPPDHRLAGPQRLRGRPRHRRQAQTRRRAGGSSHHAASTRIPGGNGPRRNRAVRSARRFSPFEGRLLFFWDGICGPWIDSAASCRVIWDRSSPARRAMREIPDALAHDDDPHQGARASSLRKRQAWSRSGPCRTAASSRI